MSHQTAPRYGARAPRYYGTGIASLRSPPVRPDFGLRPNIERLVKRLITNAPPEIMLDILGRVAGGVQLQRKLYDARSRRHAPPIVLEHKQQMEDAIDQLLLYLPPVFSHDAAGVEQPISTTSLRPLAGEAILKNSALYLSSSWALELVNKRHFTPQHLVSKMSKIQHVNFYITVDKKMQNWSAGRLELLDYLPEIRTTFPGIKSIMVQFAVERGETSNDYLRRAQAPALCYMVERAIRDLKKVKNIERFVKVSATIARRLNDFGHFPFPRACHDEANCMPLIEDTEFAVLHTISAADGGLTQIAGATEDNQDNTDDEDEEVEDGSD